MYLYPYGLYLGIDPDELAALIAVVGEYVLVALDAVGVIVPEHVPEGGAIK